MLTHIDKLKSFLDTYRPLPKDTVISLDADFAIRYNHESNRIEGNTLTLVETRVFLENGLTTKGKPFKDFLDVINHKHAIDYMMDIVQNNEALSEPIIKEFNSLLLKSTSHDAQSGVYRAVPITIAGSPHQPPQPYMVAPKIESLVQEYNASQEHPIRKIARFHAQFEAIHPFIDGNGRTGRLIMNTELMKHGYPLAIIKNEEKASYYEALIEADNGNYEGITELVGSEVKNSIMHILTIIDPEWMDKDKSK